ncbi:hypothetical protein K432DRAFT_115944 [Lepidopterella palustris CBS 459.81]|uniref:Uncharacterized protein n=1 Tax=Lepidopterella palustris CBS 459.81 TaxID=1314670 RepID=A0A8E2JJ44_9PEZI|nr:hypothetical protein K432DRAFT_115944 [Lepidopterella palustris CBS 459.81]
MPRYYCTGTRVRLSVANLAATIHPDPQQKKGTIAQSNVENAEHILRNGRILSETVVPVAAEDGKEDRGRLHFLGKDKNIPFMMVHAGADLFKVVREQDTGSRRGSGRQPLVKSLQDSAYSALPTTPREPEAEQIEESFQDGHQEGRRKTGPSTRNNPQASNLNLSIAPSEPLYRNSPTSSIYHALKLPEPEMIPQALCLQILLSPETFLRDFSSPHKPRDLKIDVLFNGVLANSNFISNRERNNLQNRSLSQLFAGSRMHYLKERPWVILPPGQEADGSLRGLKRSKAAGVGAQERWDQIGASLMAEADGRGFDKYGERPPTGDYFQSLAELRMPEIVENLQKPGGPKFGVIDVVISVGEGKKLLGSAQYLKEPTRLGDPSCKILSEEDRNARQMKFRPIAHRDFHFDHSQTASSTSPDYPSSETLSEFHGLGTPMEQPMLAAGLFPAPVLHSSGESTFWSPPPLSFPPLSSSLSDYASSPEDGRHRRGQMRVGSLGGKGVGETIGLPSQPTNSAMFGYYLDNASSQDSIVIPALRSRQNSMTQPPLAMNIMPPPQKPASSFGISPFKRRRNSTLPTPDDWSLKRRGSFRRNSEANTTGKNSQPTTALGISRRGVFTAAMSPVGISPIKAKTVQSGIGKNAATLSNASVNSISSARPSLVIKRVLITAKGKAVLDKTFSAPLRLASSVPRSKPPPRRSVRVASSEVPGSAPDGDSTLLAYRSKAEASKDPATPPPSSPQPFAGVETATNAEKDNVKFGRFSAPSVLGHIIDRDRASSERTDDVKITSNLSPLSEWPANSNDDTVQPNDIMSMDGANDDKVSQPGSSSNTRSKGKQKAGIKPSMNRPKGVTLLDSANTTPVVPIPNAPAAPAITHPTLPLHREPSDDTLDLSSVPSTPNSAKIPKHKAKPKTRRDLNDDPDDDFAPSLAKATPTYTITPSATATATAGSVLGFSNRKHIRVRPEYGFFDTPPLSQDCVITYAKAGPWSAVPVSAGAGVGLGTGIGWGEVVRQVRCERPGWFKEDEVVFAVRFLVG